MIFIISDLFLSINGQNIYPFLEIVAKLDYSDYKEESRTLQTRDLRSRALSLTWDHRFVNDVQLQYDKTVGELKPLSRAKLPELESHFKLTDMFNE